jgi:hypothetical protein
MMHGYISVGLLNKTLPNAPYCVHLLGATPSLVVLDISSSESLSADPTGAAHTQNGDRSPSSNKS